MNDNKLIEQKIEEYLSSNNIEYDDLDEGFKQLLAKGTKGSFKSIAWLIEKSFDLLVKEISDGLQRSAVQTSMDKIGKIKNREKQLKALEKQANFHKESFIRVIYRIEELNNSY